MKKVNAIKEEKQTEKRRATAKVVVEVACELDKKKVAREFYNIIRSERF